MRRVKHDDDPAPSGADDAPRSKSSVKREMEALEELVRALVELPARQLAALPLDDDARAAIVAARDMKRAAQRRQIRYARALLSAQDPAAVRAALAAQRQPARDQVRALHEVESWRDRLLAGEDDAVIAMLEGRCAGLDPVRVRGLADSARRERDRGLPPRAARELFRYLAALREQA